MNKQTKKGKKKKREKKERKNTLKYTQRSEMFLY